MMLDLMMLELVSKFVDFSPPLPRRSDFEVARAGLQGDIVLHVASFHKVCVRQIRQIPAPSLFKVGVSHLDEIVIEQV